MSTFLLKDRCENKVPEFVAQSESGKWYRSCMSFVQFQRPMTLEAARNHPILYNVTGKQTDHWTLDEKVKKAIRYRQFPASRAAGPMQHHFLVPTDVYRHWNVVFTPNLNESCQKIHQQGNSLSPQFWLDFDVRPLWTTDLMAPPISFITPVWCSLRSDTCSISAHMWNVALLNDASK